MVAGKEGGEGAYCLRGVAAVVCVEGEVDFPGKPYEVEYGVSQRVLLQALSVLNWEWQ